MVRKLIFILFFALFFQVSSLNAGTTGSEDLSKSQDTAK